MANTARPLDKGLQPTGRTLDGGFFVETKPFKKDADESGPICIFDVVQLEADGNIEANSITPGTSRYLGVNISNYAPGAKASEHIIAHSPSAVFVAQADADPDGLVRGDIGALINLEYVAGTEATRFFSQTVLDRSAAAPDSTSSKDCRIVGWHEAVDNEPGQYARVEVILNKHIFNKEVAGV